MTQQERKAALVEASRKALERRTADIAARIADSMRMADPLDDDLRNFEFLDFRHSIKNTDINK